MGGDGGGGACVFPVEYDGVIYAGCSTRGKLSGHYEVTDAAGHDYWFETSLGDCVTTASHLVLPDNKGWRCLELQLETEVEDTY